jgi:hypothetical protein
VVDGDKRNPPWKRNATTADKSSLVLEFKWLVLTDYKSIKI